MSMLHAIVRAMFKGQDVEVAILPNRDAYRVSVIFTERDLARYRHDYEGAAKKLAALRPLKRHRRRLHWGRRR